MESTETAVVNKKTCVLRYVNEMLGGKWRTLIVWRLHQYTNMRYNEIKKSLPGITNIMLTRSLQSLEENGIVNRIDFKQIPPKVEYSLTENGKQLGPGLDMFFNWGKERIIKENLEPIIPDPAKDKKIKYK